MQNHELTPDLDAVRKELIEVLNQKEVLLKLDIVLKKYGLSGNKNVTIEFKISDKNQHRNIGSSPENARSASIAAVSQTLAFDFCDTCLPPPGRFT